MTHHAAPRPQPAPQPAVHLTAASLTAAAEAAALQAQAQAARTVMAVEELMLVAILVARGLWGNAMSAGMRRAAHQSTAAGQVGAPAARRAAEELRPGRAQILHRRAAALIVPEAITSHAEAQLMQDAHVMITMDAQLVMLIQLLALAKEQM